MHPYQNTHIHIVSSTYNLALSMPRYNWEVKVGFGLINSANYSRMRRDKLLTTRQSGFNAIAKNFIVSFFILNINFIRVFLLKYWNIFLLYVIPVYFSGLVTNLNSCEKGSCVGKCIYNCNKFQRQKEGLFNYLLCRFNSHPVIVKYFHSWAQLPLIR